MCKFTNVNLLLTSDIYKLISVNLLPTSVNLQNTSVKSLRLYWSKKCPVLLFGLKSLLFFTGIVSVQYILLKSLNSVGQKHVHLKSVC